MSNQKSQQKYRYTPAGPQTLFGRTHTVLINLLMVVTIVELRADYTCTVQVVASGPHRKQRERTKPTKQAGNSSMKPHCLFPSGSSSIQPIIRAARPMAANSRPVARRGPVPAALESDSAAAAVVVVAPPPAAGVVFVARMAGPDVVAPPPPETVMASFIPEAQWPGAPQMK